jgi:hypothetical protein
VWLPRNILQLVRQDLPIRVLLTHGLDRCKTPRNEVQRMPILCQVAAPASSGPVHNSSIMALRHVGSRLRGTVPNLPQAATGLY